MGTHSTIHWASRLKIVVAIAAAAVLSGCDVADRGGGRPGRIPPRAEARSPQPAGGAGLISAELSLASLEAPSPEPGPAPEGETKCANCDGTGVLGDGNIQITCPVCGGDGVVDQGSKSEREESPQDAAGGRDAQLALLTQRINQLEARLATVESQLADHDDWRERLVAWLNRKLGGSTAAEAGQSEEQGVGTRYYRPRRSLFGRR